MKPIEPVRKEIVVEAPVERAFRVFTTRPETWWPATHHIGKSELQSIVLEPHAGGRWLERGIDGSECLWGKVLSWEPPRRVVLGWQLDANWEYDPDLLTEVEVTFTPEGSGRTRVMLEHRNLERFGADAEQVRTSIGADGGWPVILNGYADAVRTAPVAG